MQQKGKPWRQLYHPKLYRLGSWTERPNWEITMPGSFPRFCFMSGTAGDHWAPPHFIYQTIFQHTAESFLPTCFPHWPLSQALSDLNLEASEVRALIIVDCLLLRDYCCEFFPQSVPQAGTSLRWLCMVPEVNSTLLDVPTNWYTDRKGKWFSIGGDLWLSSVYLWLGITFVICHSDPTCPLSPSISPCLSTDSSLTITLMKLVILAWSFPPRVHGKTRQSPI